MPQLLVENDASRLSRMLADYEAGRLYRNESVPEVAQRAPIEHYIACTLTAIDASDGIAATTGSAVVVGCDAAGNMTLLQFTLPVYSLWNVFIGECTWVHLGRDPYSGHYFVISIPGSSCCGSLSGSGSGSGIPQWYCLASPPESSGGDGDDSGSSGSGDCGPYDYPGTLCVSWTGGILDGLSGTLTLTSSSPDGAQWGGTMTVVIGGITFHFPMLALISCGEGIAGWVQAGSSSWYGGFQMRGDPIHGPFSYDSFGNGANDPPTFLSQFSLPFNFVGTSSMYSDEVATVTGC